ncbi:ATP-binding cassette domain-containing protein [Pedobacter agri]|uniref:ATP-binding cassette domain-containing protein n=1 Tax=Pedobacter agri TaxID=454586 RepID=UPI000299D33A|nr:ATP-binding cassette domain-containing protein [Pedobacter agri]
MKPVIFFDDDPGVHRSLRLLGDVGLGYIKLGQSATALSGGEAQRIKLATELQKTQKGSALYILDEPTTGLHPSDVEKLLIQLNHLVDSGNTVIVVEHDMQVIAQSDWIIDIGPGAGDQGGNIVYSGVTHGLTRIKESKTAPFLKRYLTSFQSA